MPTLYIIQLYYGGKLMIYLVMPGLILLVFYYIPEKCPLF